MTKRLVYRINTANECYPTDIDRIVAACKAAGFEIRRMTAILAWTAFSDSMCATWMMVDGYSDVLIAAIVLSYCEQFDDQEDIDD